MSIQVAGAAPAIPTLKRATSRYELRLGVNIHDTVPDGLQEARKPIHPVRVDAIEAGIGEEARAQLSPFFLKPEPQQNFQQSSMDLLIRDSDHSDEILGSFTIVRQSFRVT
jgi:hypothetical protein